MVGACVLFAFSAQAESLAPPTAPVDGKTYIKASTSNDWAFTSDGGGQTGYAFLSIGRRTEFGVFGMQGVIDMSTPQLKKIVRSKFPGRADPLPYSMQVTLQAGGFSSAAPNFWTLSVFGGRSDAKLGRMTQVAYHRAVGASLPDWSRNPGRDMILGGAAAGFGLSTPAMSTVAGDFAAEFGCDSAVGLHLARIACMPSLTWTMVNFAPDGGDRIARPTRSYALHDPVLRSTGLRFGPTIEWTGADPSLRAGAAPWASTVSVKPWRAGLAGVAQAYFGYVNIGIEVDVMTKAYRQAMKSANTQWLRQMSDRKAALTLSTAF